MTKANELRQVLNGGFRYGLNKDGILTLTGYCTDKEIKIDLLQLIVNEEMLEELLAEMKETMKVRNTK